jgi:hypothetical protein
MQLFHALIAAAAVFVLLRWSPLPRWQKGLAAFGFFLSYEYAVVSRCYVLGVLLAFVFCAMFRQREKRVLGLSVVLFLLANTSAFGLLLSGALAAALVAAWFLDKRAGRPWNVSRRTAVASALIYACGVGACLWQISLPEDAVICSSKYYEFDLDYLQSVVTALSRQYWFPTHLLPRHLPPRSVITVPLIWLAVTGWGFWQSVGFLAASILVIGRRPAAMVFYLCATVSVFFVCYVGKTSAVWHMGHLFIAFLIALWLAGYYAARPPGAKTKARVLAGWAAGIYIGAVLVCQVAATVYADYLDYLVPFSNGKAAAECIRSHNLQDLPIVGDPDYTASTVAGYLDRPIYYISSSRYGTYIIWDHLRSDGTASVEELMEAFAKLSNNGRKRTVWVLPCRLGAAVQRGLNARLIRVFSNDNWAAEDYFIYLTEPRRAR